MKHKKTNNNPEGNGKAAEITQIPNKAAVDKALAEILEFIKSKGINGFILLFQPVDGLTVFHIAEMKMRPAFSALMTAFDQVIALELENNKTGSKGYRAALEDLLFKFHNAVKEANGKLDTFHANGKEIPSA